MVQQAQGAADAILENVQLALRHAPSQELVRPCVYAFALTGPGAQDLWIRLSGGYAEAGKGYVDRADCRITLSLVDAVQMVRNPSSVIGAYLSGRVQIEGDLAAAGRLGQLLRPNRRR